MKKAPPNVLFIAIDDQNDWISPLGGHPLAHTPNFDRLAARGATFANHHCQAPLCTPSRTSLMLGLRPSTTGIYGLEPWFRTVPELKDRISLPQHFHAHGYHTSSTGKVFHGGPKDEAARALEFDNWPRLPIKDPRPPKKLIPPTPGGDHPLMDWGTFPHRDEDKHDYQITSWAISELQHHRDQPFFLSLGYFLPHVPCYVNQHWLDLIPANHPQLIPPLPPGDDRADTPRFSWYLHWDLPEPRRSWLEENHQLCTLARSYLAASAFTDAQIGRLLDTLDSTGLAENTYIVVWADHGYHLGEKSISGKNSLWERSTHVPLFIAGPDITPSTRITEPTEHLDIYPTLVDLCGLTPREDLEGLSLKPLIKNPALKRERPALTTHNPDNHAIRTERWRYIRYADDSEELYDHLNDPHEWTNLASDPSTHELRATLRRWLPAVSAPHVSGSVSRRLTYDKATDIAYWENKPITRQTPFAL